MEHADGDYTLSSAASEGDRAYIRERLREFNNRMSPQHLAARLPPGSPRPLDVIVRDRAGRVAGGLVASTYWGWLEIDHLWLADALRGRGYGTRLMALAEEEARRRGCTRAKVETFSFQARGFYEKRGYRVVGRLDDFPPGETFYWLRKDFA